MRSLSRSLVLLSAACGPAPRSTPEVMPEVAAEYGARFNERDEAGMLALFAPGRVGAAVPPDQLEWFHEQLGECEDPQFMWSFERRGARFSYPCERGALEVAFVLDEAGKIVDMSAGAAGIPASAQLTDAAHALLESLPWQPGASRPFKHNFDWRTVEKLGRCQIVRPWWVVRSSGAVFHSECEHGDAALLTVRLHADGTLAYASLVHSKTVYFGPPVWLPEPRG